jgi:alkylhydroperoxidase family enzyme
MAYIELVSEDSASGQLAEIYELAKKRAGGVANILKVMSQDAATLETSMQFYISLMKSKNALSNARKEMLAAVVSNVNDCFY